MGRMGESAARLRRRALGVWAAVILSLSAGAFPYYRSELRRIRAEQAAMLKTVADLKITQIRAWRRQRVGDVRWSSRSPLFRKAVFDLFAGRDAEVTRRVLAERLRQERQERGHSQVLVLDANLDVMLAAIDGERDIGPDTRRAIEDAVREDTAVIGSLYWSSGGELRLDAVSPVRSEDGALRALVVVRVDPKNELYPLVEYWPTPSPSAETLLVTRDGPDVLWLSELRHRRGAAFTLRAPLTRTDLPAVQAVEGRTGLWEGRDYRGVPVLAYLAPIPESPWFMVSKIDASEVFAEARYRAGVILGALLLLAALAGLSISLVLNRWQGRMFRSLYQAERQKREVESEFRATLYSIGDAVITTDHAGVIRQMNGVAERLTAWREQDATGRPVSEVFRVVNETSREVAEDPVERVLREGAVVGLANHTLLLARDGREYPIADSAAPIHDGSSDIHGVVLVFRDQTEERAQQRRLEHLVRVLRAVRRINQAIVRESDPEALLAAVCTLLVDERGYRGAWSVLNPGFGEASSVALAGFLEAPQQEIAAGLRVARVPCFEQMDRSGEMVQVFAPSSDCSPCPLSTTFSSGDKLVVAALRHGDRTFGFVGIRMEEAPDVEERELVLEMVCDVSWALYTIELEQRHRDATAELTARGEMLSTVAEGIGLVRRLDGVLIFANPALEKMYGYAQGELAGRRLDEVLGVELSARLRANPPESGSTVWNDDHCVKRKDGATFWCNCSVSTWEHPEHGPVWISLHRDITKRRDLESQYRQAQKMEAVGQLAGGVAHDFNNLLAALTMQIDMLQADAREGAPDDLPDRLEEMSATTKRASSLTRQLLLFSRRQALVMAPLDLNVVLRGMGQLLSRILGERIALEIETAPGPSWVEGDHGMLEQVVMNLALNARDAMPRGGRLKMFCDEVVLSAAEASKLRGAHPGAYQRLRVVDSGQGMTEEVLGHLFEPFFTTKEKGKGTGLGLATVRSIVTQHKGFVDAESTVGVGSTFAVYLPKNQEGRFSELRPRTVSRRGGSEFILLVEDEAALRSLAVRSLTRLGYHVTAATSAEEAVRRWRERPGRFDVLFTDMVMPGPMSGLDLCRKLREDAPRLPVVITSGYSLDLVREAEALASDIVFLPKPYDIQTLATVVRESLDGPRHSLRVLER